MVLDLDPHKFDDPVALQVEWSPVEDELLALRLKRRIHNNSPTLTFNIKYTVIIVSSLSIVIFGGLFVMSIIGLISLIVQGDFDAISQSWIGFLMLWIMTLTYLFLCISVLKRLRTKRSSFDLRSGHYMQGGLSYPINKIHALQLITRVDPLGRPHIVHELNLILSDGTRRNVNDHQNLKLIRKHACILADYLEIPIWDAIPSKYDLQ